MSSLCQSPIKRGLRVRVTQPRSKALQVQRMRLQGDEDGRESGARVPEQGAYSVEAVKRRGIGEKRRQKVVEQKE